MTTQLQRRKVETHLYSIFGHLGGWRIFDRVSSVEKKFPEYYVYTVSCNISDINKMLALAQLHGLEMENTINGHYFYLYYRRHTHNRRVSLIKRIQKFFEYIRLESFKS